MRCHLCLNISRQFLCENCLNTILIPNPSKRVLDSGLIVYAAYNYLDIKKFLHTKHTYYGAKIFAQLTKHGLLPLVKELTYKGIYSLPIDDHTRSGYSHSAIIARELRDVLKPLYGKLRAKNKIRYSGQNLHVREKNQRDFIFTCKKKLDVVLIDDIVTTGNTLNEANITCKKNDVNVLFAITIANTR
ncbi:MAG: ComF family protein [Sulfurospirillum sp.]|nr:ComF family protein [Sulfurospirillum sp.]MBL0703232.1 ComF family protein [Sulfurospirillum sp.]